ncbi:MAG: c-type cytochrome domain-containing protein, partial [Pirellulales bacterium]
MVIFHNNRCGMSFSLRETVVWSALLLIGMCNTAHVFSDEPSPETIGEAGQLRLPAEDAFQTQTTLFLKTYCVKCHGAKTQEGDLRLDTVLHDLADDKTARLWNDIFAQIQFSEMPPSDSEQQ